MPEVIEIVAINKNIESAEPTNLRNYTDEYKCIYPGHFFAATYPFKEPISVGSSVSVKIDPELARQSLYAYVVV